MRFLPIIVACLCAASATEVEEDQEQVPLEEQMEIDEEDFEKEFERIVNENTVEDRILDEDKNLSEEEKKLRMKTCISLARDVFVQAEERMKNWIDYLMKKESLEEERAVETVHISMIKTCYISMRQDSDIEELKTAEKEGNTHEWISIASRLVFIPPEDDVQQYGEFAPSHWEMIRQIIFEETQQKRKEQAAPKIKVIGSDMNALQKVLYLMLVFGAIFGGGYWLVKKLIQKDLDKQAKRNKKKKTN